MTILEKIHEIYNKNYGLNESNLLYNDIKNDYANWIIPGRLMCGPYPGIDNINFHLEVDAKSNIDLIIADGIDTFICLQSEERFIDNKPSYARFVKRECQYIHLPIIDGGAPNKKEFIKNLVGIIQELENGKKIYIHCAGGHGRTGLYVCGLIMLLYKVDVGHALHITQYLHDKRRKIDRRVKSKIPCRIAENDPQLVLLREFDIFCKFI